MLSWRDLAACLRVPMCSITQTPIHRFSSNHSTHNNGKPAGLRCGGRCRRRGILPPSWPSSENCILTRSQGDLGQNDLDDLEFHNSSMPHSHLTQSQCKSDLFPAFDTSQNASRTKVQPDQQSSFLNNPSRQPSSSKRFLWSIAFYQQFFDVDTNQILLRCRSALFPRQNFLDIMEGNPDLYGPFWIATTVVVILFLTGTISQYLAFTGKTHFAYDFRLLSGAAGLVYGYTAIIPLALWGILKWFGSESANLMECWALYGYANLIWIPVALVSWSPLTGELCTNWMVNREDMLTYSQR